MQSKKVYGTSKLTPTPPPHLSRPLGSVSINPSDFPNLVTTIANSLASSFNCRQRVKTKKPGLPLYRLSGFFHSISFPNEWGISTNRFNLHRDVSIQLVSPASGDIESISSRGDLWKNPLFVSIQLVSPASGDFQVSVNMCKSYRFPFN